ncbi:MAG: hypothetical protein JO170_04615 [Verrucomicrobia bacterium]|nr:hypothetical protein [Verrucomicrobiota bacterium]
MLILHISQRSKCEYAWRQNAIVAKVMGVEDQQVAAIRQGAIAAPRFTESEMAAFRFVDEAMDLIEVTDPTFERAKQFFSDRALAEILYIVGAYMFIARIGRTARVPFDRMDEETALAATTQMMAKHGNDPAAN